MAYTKAQATTVIRDWLDDPSGVRWAPASFDLQVSMILDGLWRNILTALPRTRVARATVALASPGVLDVSTLDSRFHGLISLVRDGRHMSEVNQKDVVVEAGVAIVSEQDTYMKLGDELHIFPYTYPSTVELVYSYIPPVFSGLADGAAVVWPEGHELAYVLRVAGLLSLKGNVEDSNQMLIMAEREWLAMMSTLTGQTPGGQSMFLADSATSWGG